LPRCPKAGCPSEEEGDPGEGTSAEPRYGLQ
jgi:hypothetical protein